MLLADVPRVFKEKSLLLATLAYLVLGLPSPVRAQDWTWTKEVADTSGASMSLAADDLGNVHISYQGQGGLQYGYRPAGANSKWFTMSLGGGAAFTNLRLDKQGNPHICATYLSLPLRYAHYDGKTWDIQKIAPEDTMTVQAQCSVAIAADGTPHLTWYRIDVGYAHLRYATL
jgi:hypothetical protein